MGLAMLDAQYYRREHRRPVGDIATQSRISLMSAPGVPPTLASVTEELPTQRVEVSFVGAPPIQQVERASGVSDVEIDGSVLRCMVWGSFQPFLEALRGHEVTSLQSRPTHATSEMGMGEE
jgi:hypothetical protein